MVSANFGKITDYVVKITSANFRCSTIFVIRRIINANVDRRLMCSLNTSRFIRCYFLVREDYVKYFFLNLYNAESVNLFSACSDIFNFLRRSVSC